MKATLILLLAVVVAWTSAAKIQPIKCTLNPMLVRCTNELKQVCSIRYENGKQVRATYANSCLGCAVGKADFYLPESCDFYPENAVFCSPQQKQAEMCTFEYRETCGWFSRDTICVRFPCAVGSSNPCDACSKENVIYYTEGACEKSIGI